MCVSVCVHVCVCTCVTSMCWWLTERFCWDWYGVTLVVTAVVVAGGTSRHDNGWVQTRRGQRSNGSTTWEDEWITFRVHPFNLFDPPLYLSPAYAAIRTQIGLITPSFSMKGNGSASAPKGAVPARPVPQPHPKDENTLVQMAEHIPAGTRTPMCAQCSMVIRWEERGGEWICGLQFNKNF